VQEFVNPSITPGVIDLYPLSAAGLIDSGTFMYDAPSDDFNWWVRPENAGWDIGAYEWSQSANPGWQIQEGFKEIHTGIEENELAIPVGSSVTCRIITSSKISFNNIIPGSVIRIYDITGRLMHDSGMIREECYELSSRIFASGVYLFAVWPTPTNIVQTARFLILR
jgi:hypothetical protein